MSEIDHGNTITCFTYCIFSKTKKTCQWFIIWPLPILSSGEKKTERTEKKVEITKTSRTEIQVTKMAETGEPTSHVMSIHHANTIGDGSVYTTPQFLNPIRSLSATEGHPACFDCCISGTPPPNITWLLEGEVLTDHDLYEFQSFPPDGTFSLTIHEAYPEDGGIYECQALNPYGVASSVARLTILNPGVCCVTNIISFSYNSSYVVYKKNYDSFCIVVVPLNLKIVS